MSVALGASVLCLASACSGPAKVATGPSPSATVPAARITIRPRSGTHTFSPARAITVRVAHGRLVRVVVKGPGQPIVGRLSPSATAWRSRTTLEVDARYRIEATAVDAAGKQTTARSSFRTLTPNQTFSAEIFEAAGATYGVGMPIILDFDRPVTDRRAVERSLELWTSKRVVGAWYWDDPSTLYFRPRDYWPAGTRVRFVAHLDGVEASPGIYGEHDLSQSFVIGGSLIVVADTQTHRALIYRDKRLYADWPMSSGRPGDDTPNGTYLTIDKGNPVEMKGPGYDLMVPWSVRFTWSGDFLHDAYWSVGEQGFTNVSHGCVNLSPADAQTYYEMEVPGDPVTIKGSPRAGTWDNGWTVWFLSFKQLWQGSALHEAVVAGPAGSTFVRPARLHHSFARAPLGRPAAGNAAAA